MPPEEIIRQDRISRPADPTLTESMERTRYELQQLVDPCEVFTLFDRKYTPGNVMPPALQNAHDIKNWNIQLHPILTPGQKPNRFTVHPFVSFDRFTEINQNT